VVQAPFAFTWQAQSGSHTIKVVASDAANNSAQDSVTVTVSTAAFSCRSFSATNLEHVAAGRAEAYTKWLNPYARTIGGGDDLGLLGSTYYSATTTVSETQPGYFVAGGCP